MFCKRTDAPKFASFQNHLQHRAMPRPVLQKICTMPKSVPTCCLPFTSGLFLWFSRIRTGVFLLHLVCMWYEVIRLQFTRLSAVSRSVLILMIVASKGSISTRRPNLIEMRWSTKENHVAIPARLTSDDWVQILHRHRAKETVIGLSQVFLALPTKENMYEEGTRVIKEDRSSPATARTYSRNYCGGQCPQYLFLNRFMSDSCILLRPDIFEAVS